MFVKMWGWVNYIYLWTIYGWTIIFGKTDEFYEEGVCVGSVGIKQTERTTEADRFYENKLHT